MDYTRKRGTEKDQARDREGEVESFFLKEKKEKEKELEGKKRHKTEKGKRLIKGKGKNEKQIDTLVLTNVLTYHRGV
jgi:hypothetical protein